MKNSMWVARDEDNTLHLFDGEIIRITNNCPSGYWHIPNGYFNSSMQLNEKLFPDLKWEDEPIEVHLVSKSVDEEKLDELAVEYLETLIVEDSEEAFKAGYHKAKEK